MVPLLLAAILIGIVLPVQSGINAQLRVGVTHPLLAAFISFFVGTIALLGFNLALRVPAPSGEALGRIPWWQWTGGLLGALYIYAAVILAPRLGAATLVAAIVAGQMLASVILDHFGLVGYQQQSLTPGRLIGVLLVIGGVILIQRR
jgi:bacterial/archaeal transporter family-2 protein